MAILFNRNKDQSQLILFFLHNFFISIGTVLVYVSANIILLENHPEFSLPIAYICSTFTMMGVGKIYEYYEHHYLLQKLSSRVLLAVLVMSLLMVVIVFLSHTMFTAIGIMVGFRIIYLLVNLEFWGVSAVIFDVRQSKRIFSVIGSGDVPAKAIGAILTVLIHSTSVLSILILVAFLTFLMAFYTQKQTFKLTTIPEVQPEKTRRKIESKYITQLFGGSRLVFEMCIGLVAVSLSATWIEYNFFVYVKYKFHSQHDIISFVGYILAITYSISTIIKLLLSSKVIDRFGLRNTLLILPIGTVAISAILLTLSSIRNDEASLLIDFSVAYFLFEVMRRTLFDPVFLVMFQPLSTHQRLKGHTLAKGFYEPLGMGIAGLLLLAEYYFDFSFTWIEFGFTVVSAFVAFYFLSRAFHHYIIELKTVLSKRFLKSDELVIQGDALKLILKNIESTKPEEVIGAIDWVSRYDASKLDVYLPKLLQNPSEKVRLLTLQEIERSKPNNDILNNLTEYVFQEKDDLCRKMGVLILSSSNSINEEKLATFLNSNDIFLIEGTLIGNFGSENKSNLAQKKLDEFCEKNSSVEQKQAALSVIKTLKLNQYESFVKESFDNNFLKENAIETAGILGTSTLIKELISVLTNRSFSKKALTQLVILGEKSFAEISKLKTESNSHLLQKLVAFCEKHQTIKSRDLLIELIKTKPLAIKSASLKALSTFPEEIMENDDNEKFLENEIEQAYQLLNGFGEIDESALQYELLQSSNRIFYILMLLYDKNAVQDAMQGVEHSSKEKRANALEILDNIIPRGVYKCLHALLDDTVIDDKKAIFKTYLGKELVVKPINDLILEKGEYAFGDWTIAKALESWKPIKEKISANEIKYFNYFILHPKNILREAAQTAISKNEVLKQNIAFEKYINPTSMSHSHETSSISELERVMVLKNTQLFAETPENVLTSIVPIMKETGFHEGTTIFKKGEIGNCMYIIYAGEISIYDHETLLATFIKGDVFGELALLDAEPRSAAAIAESDVLLFRIDQEDFYDLMEERNELLRSVLRILCQRIRNQNNKIRGLS